MVSLPAPSERLAAALAQLRERTGGTVATAAAAPPPAAPAPVEPRPPSRFARQVGQRLAQIFDAATDALIESLPRKLRRTPGEADPSDLTDFEDAATEIVQRWVPDIDAGPYGKLAIAAVFVVGGKWVEGEPINNRAALAPAAATTTPPTTTTPPAAPPITAPPAAPPAAEPPELAAVGGP